MKKIILFIAVVLVVFSITSCKKILEGTQMPPVNENPLPTEVGDAAGAVVIKKIGSSGGSIASADGKIELQIPAGALNSEMEISVQPITNKAPNGLGNGYRFMPDGLQFLKPASLKINYSGLEGLPSVAGLLGIAFQDNSGIWWRLNNFSDDVVNKTISVPMMHFSDWTLFDVMSITPVEAALKVNKSLNLKVTYVNAADDDSLLAPLLNKVGKISWSASAGSLTSGSDGDMSRTFKAPAKLPSQNPVAVAAQVQIKFKYHGKTFDNTTLVSNVKIFDGDEVYLLEMRVIDSSWFAGMKTTDSVSMKVKVNDTTVTISDIKNFPSTAVPERLVLGNSTVIWINDPIGELNITKATGRNAVDFFGPNTGLLGFDFTHTDVHTPKYHIVTVVGPNTDDQYYGGGVAGFLGGTSFQTTTGKTYYEQGSSDPNTNIKVLVKLSLQL